MFKANSLNPSPYPLLQNIASKFSKLSRLVKHKPSSNKHEVTYSSKGQCTSVSFSGGKINIGILERSYSKPASIVPKKISTEDESHVIKEVEGDMVLSDDLSLSPKDSLSSENDPLVSELGLKFSKLSRISTKLSNIFMQNRVAASVAFCVIATASYYVYHAMNSDDLRAEDEDSLPDHLCAYHLFSYYKYVADYICGSHKSRSGNVQGVCELPKMVLGNVEDFRAVQWSLNFFINPVKLNDSLKYLFSRAVFHVGDLKDPHTFSGTAKLAGTGCCNPPSIVRMSLWQFINYFLERVIEPNHNGIQCSAFSFVYTLYSFVNNYDCFGPADEPVCNQVSRYYHSGEAINPPHYMFGLPVLPLSYLTGVLIDHCMENDMPPVRYIIQ